jgi:uncharacterized protein (TIGR02099 family)
MRLRKFGKFLLYGLGGCLALVLLLMLALKLALDRVPAYQAEIKDWVHRQTGLYIRFAHVAPRLHWYGPEFYFDQLELRSKDDQRVLARAAGGRIGADIGAWFRSGKLLAGRVRLDEPNIVLARIGPHDFALASEIELQGQTAGAARLTLDDLPAGDVEIRGGRFTILHWNEALPELVLDRVDLDLQRESDRLSFTIGARLPPGLGGGLRASGAAEGLGDWESLAWHADMRARDVEFAGWHLLLPEYLANLDAGRGTFELSANGNGAIIAAANLDFDAEGVRTQLSDGRQTRFDQIAGLVTLTHVGDRWSLRGRRLRALQAGNNDPISRFDVTWRASPAGLLDAHARADYLRADGLLPLLGLLPASDVRERLLAIAPTGEWFDARLDLQRALVDAPWQMQVHARFHNVGFAPVGLAPGVRGITGEIAGNQNGGRIDLDASGGHIAWPRQWSEPVDLDAAHAVFYWQHTADGLLLATPGIRLETHDAQLRARMALRLPSNGESPDLTLAAQLDNGNVTAAHRYLPKAVIAPKTVDWLNQALVAGRLSHADIVLRGPLRKFPFRDRSGIFLARADFSAITLDYQAHWPRIEDLAGRLDFRDEGMTATLTSGSVGAVRLESGDASFPDFKAGELTVHVAAGGDAGDVIRFMRETPVNALTGQVFSSVEAHGLLHTKVELFLPFRDFIHRRVLVQGLLHDATLNRPGLPLTATDLNGDFLIDGGQLARADIRGRLLGGAFRAQARAPKARPLTRTQLDLRGTLTGEGVSAALGLPSAVPLRGSSDWHGVLKLAPDPARERSLHVTGSLSGIEMALPQPLSKPYGRPLPSWLDIQWPSGGGSQINLALGSIVRAVFLMEPDPDSDETRLTHAAVMFGEADPIFSDTQIINVGGRIERLDLGGWLRLVAPDKSGRPLTYYLRTADLDIGTVDFIGLNFHDVNLNVSARGDRWHFAVDGPNLVGTIAMPMAIGSPDPWDLQFDRITLNESSMAPAADGAGAPDAGAPADAVTANPRSVPAMRFSVDDFTWSKAHLGKVRATLSKRDDGIGLDQLTMTSPSFNVSAQGEWRGRDAGLGRLIGTMTSTDVQASLAQLGAADVISAKSGRVDFDLSWVGAPSSDSLSEASGHVQIALDKGQLLGVKPGAGRVLGLASLTALPRRLALDFSDLTDKGLAFDSARGDFDLRDGNAHTDNVLIKGPAAEIGLIGRIGLKARDYDQTAVVTGSVGNSLPIAGIAGAFAGGPVVGAAVLLFTQVFKQPLKGLARAYYRIGGSWENPSIERISSGAGAAGAAGAEAAKETGNK